VHPGDALRPEAADPAPNDSGVLDGPGRLGWFDIDRVSREGDVVLLFEHDGALLDNAGFAYLPDGPDPDLENGTFESPSYTHLGGPWYAFTASW